MLLVLYFVVALKIIYINIFKILEQYIFGINLCRFGVGQSRPFGSISRTIVLLIFKLTTLFLLRSGDVVDCVIFSNVTCLNTKKSSEKLAKKLSKVDI